MTYYINGSFIPQAQARINVDDLGLLRGYGIFDFFKSINGEAIFIEDHLTRFEHSAQRMHLPIPQSRDELRNTILELIQKNPHPTLGIKMILTGGYSEDGYSPAQNSNLIMLAKPFAATYPAKPQKLMTCKHQRELHDIKTTNYLTPILNIPRMRAMSADDVLYYNEESILESSRSNIFIIKGNTLITPKDNILYGISRKHILQRASKLFQIEERRIPLAELFTADEVFISSSTKRVVPITSIDDCTFSQNTMGRITNQISELMKDV
jgi:D-alanine transaminase/branched-chain amino acid aminotransferase